MLKRISLFILGLAIAIGAFLAYQYLTNSSLHGGRKRPQISASLPGEKDGRLSLDMRHPNGDPYYEIRAAKVVAATNPAGPPGAVLPGQYVLTSPGATIYVDSENLIVISADSATASIDTVASSSGKSPRVYPRGGRLHGHVVLTYGPKATFDDLSPGLKPGQLQITFDDDVVLNHIDRLLTSAGNIHVRSEQILSNNSVFFDGAGLTIAYNPDERRIELLRIDKGNQIIVKNVGAEMFDLSAGAATQHADATTTSAPASATAAAAPATRVASAPATGKAPGTPATTYRLSFGNNVKASLGASTLTSDQLFLLFMASMANPTTQPAKSAAQSTATTHAATASGPATTQTVPPLPKAQPQDLIVQWTGPMEMRPAGKDDLKLTSSKDLALEAIGSRERPVVLKYPPLDLETSSGRMSGHAADQTFQLDPGDFGAVILTVPDKGSLACQGMSYSPDPATRGPGTFHFIGPGRLEFDDSALKLPPTAVAGAPAKHYPVTAAFDNSLDLALASLPDPKHPGKTTAGPRRGVLLGNVRVKHPIFSLLADSLDIHVLPTGDNKNVAVFDSLLATDSVQFRLARPGAGLEDADGPTCINARELQITSNPPAPGKAPVPSKITATGDVIAWTYNESKGSAPADPNRLERQKIAAPSLQISLATKDKTDAAPSAGGLFGASALKELTAQGGVRVDLDRFGQLPVTATADKLTADPRSGKVTLQGAVQPNGILKMARLQQGDNQIAGATLLLDQKALSLDIPGSGEFILIQPPESGKPNEPGTPVQITWDKQMHYSGKDLVASFGKSVTAKLLGKPDQISQLTCDDGLEVKLAGGTPGAVGAKQTDLAQITASGNVKAEGSTLDKDGKPITRVYLQAPKLIYTHTTRTLDIPAAGSMLVEDFRTDDKVNANARGQTGLDWKDHLTYVGSTGQITIAKDVRMVHVPLKPFFVTAGEPKKAQQVTLGCDNLVATMLQSKTAGGGNTVANPLALGSGGNQKLSKVTASGAALLTMDDKSLAADLLDVDLLANKATAAGTEGRNASVSSSQGRAEAEQIIWDLTKNENEFTFIHLKGNFVLPK